MFKRCEFLRRGERSRFRLGRRLPGEKLWIRLFRGVMLAATFLSSCRAGRAPLGPNGVADVFKAGWTRKLQSTSAQLLSDGRGVEPDILATDQPTREFEYVHRSEANSSSVAR